ncbi:hypothetical protein ACQV5M_22110, partial [Leptospira sp. SA-E8]|uniref:hypothetical protein n=1 Tax=Leptospira sp. SA-E8 TaxID=3422259 RepID=UPI003EB8C5FA
MKGYPLHFLTCLWGVIASLMVTGLLLLPTTLLMRCDIEWPWRLSADARITVAMGHAAAAFLMLFFFGALWGMHM